MPFAITTHGMDSGFDPHVYSGNIQNMIDFDLINGFDRDAGNERKSADKHGVSMSEAEQVFFNQPLLLLEDTAHSLNFS